MEQTHRIASNRSLKSSNVLKWNRNGYTTNRSLNDNENDWDTTDTDEDSDENDEDEDSVMGDTTASSNKDKPIKWKNLSSEDGEEEMMLLFLLMKKTNNLKLMIISVFLSTES